MSICSLTEIKEIIASQHEGDEQQLKVIFSRDPRLLVEAPAGYGKTTTMISRIAYLFASGQIPNPKRILGLTFSVNAALKVKREIAERLPSLLRAQSGPASISEKMTITNYHGFCKTVLKKYGYLISDSLRKDVNLFWAAGDSDVIKRYKYNTLSPKDVQILERMETGIKNVQFPDAQSIKDYIEVLTSKLLPIGCITHNAIILFTLEIFSNYDQVRNFYQNYYPLIIVDEFQDTNCIAWNLLKQIISNQTKLLFLGDSLQRIYGFIGAIPDIMSKAAFEFGMSKVELTNNYRFRNNAEMLKLDKNIRANAASFFSPIIMDSDVAHVPAFWGKTQQSEAEKVVAKIQQLLRDGQAKIALLFRTRTRNEEIVEEELTKHNIEYFYGMFKDDDPDYASFHNVCHELFLKQFGKTRIIGKKSLTMFVNRVKAVYENAKDKTIYSLLKLLDALIEKVSIDYADLAPEDKYTLLLDIFENRQIKQAMEYVDSRVILSTVHGAKGLEWDYVFVCDVESWAFTLLCRDCPNKNLPIHNTFCRLPSEIPPQFIGPLLDDFCVFYVALTRAKRQAFISASGERYNAKGVQHEGGNICCFAAISGIKLYGG